MPKTHPGSKGNPQLSDIEGLGCCDCQYYHIRVNCAIDTLLYPSFTSSLRCSRMWLSSSCVHGANTDYLFASVESCHTGCQEEQFSPLVFNAQKLWPVSRNDSGWLNASMNSLLSLAACFSLQPFGEIFIPHDIDSADMLQLREDVW